mgnify:CR=1 FL=1
MNEWVFLVLFAFVDTILSFDTADFVFNLSFVLVGDVPTGTEILVGAFKKLCFWEVFTSSVFCLFN